VQRPAQETVKKQERATISAKKRPAADAAGLVSIRATDSDS